MKKSCFFVFPLLLILCLVCGCARTGGLSDTSVSAAPTQTDVVQTAAAAEAETTVPVPSETQTVSAAVPAETTALAAPVRTTQPSTAAADVSDAAKPTSAPQAATTVPQTTRKTLSEQIRDLQKKYAVSGDQADPAFFDDAVFVGDSVTLGLRNYTTAQRNKGHDCLGAAQFLCCGNLSYANAVAAVSADSVHPLYKGKKVSVEDGVQLCGAKKVFILLGMNDFAAYSETACQNNIRTLLKRIVTQNPSVSIYVESVTPILNGMEHGRFNNENITKFNDRLQQICADNGYTYVDIYHVLADENGCLRKDYCGDPQAMGIHMGNSGSAAWVQFLQQSFCKTDA